MSVEGLDWDDLAARKEWNEVKDELLKKWKFTPFNLLALHGKHPTIEYNNENISLVLEEEKENKMP